MGIRASFVLVVMMLACIGSCADDPGPPRVPLADRTTGGGGGGDGGGHGGGGGTAPCAGEPADLDDSNPCTVDVCDPAVGIRHTPAAAGTSCQDGDACNGAETCDGASTCLPGVPPVLDDGNPCTVDACEPAAGVSHAPAPAGTPCADADPCNGEETCDGASACALVVPPALDDGDPCTLDACEPAVGITHAACSALDLTVATTIAQATEFLYTGPDAVQTGVAAGAIDVRRAAVIRGQVRALDGSPLSGIELEVQGHPEYGTTRTFADGMFAMAVNGGGPLVVSYRGDGFLPVARQVEVPWQDYARAADVVMTPYDSQVTIIDLSAAASAAVAHGSVISDGDGVRQATVLFPPGTQAQIVLPGGTTQPLTTLSVRATEYTIGANGPDAMPATLPPTSGYTYAAELSVDEAIAAGATSVEFTHPLPFYVENFLHFPVGMAVPVGYYDRALGVWVPSANGRVIEILGAGGSLAEIDSNGDGLADDTPTLLALGVDDTEREQMAALYSAGTTLWRVPVEHLTPWDCNWPYGPPDNACKPLDPVCGPGGDGSGSGSGDGSGSGSGNGSSSSSGSGGGGGNGSGGGGGDGDGGEGGRDPYHPTPLPDPCEESGSIIECENQTLGEDIEVAGTPFRLHYRSDRVPGRKSAYTLDIPLSRGGVPPSLKRIDVVVDVAGQHVEEEFACPCAASSETTFSWGGKDAFGRTVQGEQPVTVRVGYVYDGVYMAPTQEAAAFAAMSGIPITTNRTRSEVTLWKDWQGTIGGFTALSQGLGGWTLSAHHVYDPIGRVLYLGDGRQRRAEALGGVITTVAGGGCAGCGLGDGGPAKNATLNLVSGIAVAPDGSVYLSDTGRMRVRKVAPNGVISTVAGNGKAGSGGDGGPATLAELQMARGLAVGPDGSLYIADQGNRVRKVAPNGVITTVAGTGASGYAGDGGPAIQAKLAVPFGVAVGLDGALYIADTGNHRIRRVGTDGVITTVAGDGTAGFAGDGGPARQAKFNQPRGLTVERDGGLLVVDTENHRVRRIDANGRIRTIAGTGVRGSVGDGGKATAALLDYPSAVAAAPDGSIYLADGSGYRIRRLGSDGIITHVAGRTHLTAIVDGAPALTAEVGSIAQLQVGPDSALYLAEMHSGSNRVRRIAPPPMAGVSIGEMVLPAEDGREAYVFSGVGKHLRTINTRTGAILYEMHYDAAGRLVGIVNADNDTTTIVRDAAGILQAIVGPFGQSTGLMLYPDGYLKTVTNPANETTTLTYWPEGLLKELTDPLQRTHAFSYDTLGRLERDADPAGGSKHLMRTAEPGGYGVTITTALQRSTTHHIQTLPKGTPSRTTDLPNGLTGTALGGLGGPVTTTLPDGRIVTWAPGPDPRFGMLSPFVQSEVITTPKGRTRTIARTRTMSPLDPADLMSFATLTDTTSLNGKSFVEVFAKGPRTLTRTTPLGRQTKTTLDAAGRVRKIEIPKVLPVELGYDVHGRLETVTHGSRVSKRAYRPNGYLDSVTDALVQTTFFTPDAVGRVLSELRPDHDEIVRGYDAVGNLTAVTPPGRPLHELGYTDIDLLELYDPPALPTGPTPTSWGYTLDGQLDWVTRPGGELLDIGHDAAGRRSTEASSQGTLTRTYHPVTGKLETLSGPAGVTLTFGYDGHLLTDVTWSGAVSGVLHRVFDNDLRIDIETINGANPVEYNHDADGLLTGAGGLVLTRDPQNGRLTGTTLGALTEAITYNDFGEVKDRLVQAGAATLLSLHYAPDALGRIHEKTETLFGETHVETYFYDAAGRLTDVFRDGVLATHYELDANGNRLSRTTATESEAAGHDNQDRLLTYGTKSYAYRDSGELLSRTDTATGATTHYNYDAFGNLRSVTLPGATVIEYVVDGLGRRVGKKVNGALVKGWLYSDALRPVAELDASGAVVARFAYGERVNVPEVMIKGGVTYRIVTDHLGSPRLVVNAATGTVAQRIDYDEFGRVLLDTNPGFQPFGFAGGLYDPDTGLVRFGARDFDADVGRWTAKDPLLFDGSDSNLYNYVLGDPINRRDPTGRDATTWEDFGTILLGVGAALEAPALTASGLVGLCILMALTLESDASVESDEFEYCYGIWETDNNVCRRLKTRRGRAACFASANERLGNCRAGRPMGPLVTWVN